MTKYTAVYKLPSPELPESADGPLGFSNLAAAVETALLQQRKGLSITKYRINDFNVINGATPVAVSLDGTEDATGMTWAAGGKPIIPAAGRYMIIVHASYAAMAGGNRYVVATLNGVPIPEAGIIMTNAIAGHSATIQSTYVDHFAAGAQIGLSTWQSSGKTLLCTAARLSVDMLSLA